MLIDLMRDKFYMEPYKYFPDSFFFKFFLFFRISNCKFIKSAKVQLFSLFTLSPIFFLSVFFLYFVVNLSKGAIFFYDLNLVLKSNKYLGRDMLIG
jgi:hypothetical protein